MDAAVNTIENDNCLDCDKESHYGIVGMSNNEIFHLHYCHDCYLKRRRNKEDE